MAAADLDLQEIHDTLVSIAYDAGRMILTANPSDIDQGTKLNCECVLLFWTLVSLTHVTTPIAILDLERVGEQTPSTFHRYPAVPLLKVTCIPERGPLLIHHCMNKWS